MFTISSNKTVKQFESVFNDYKLNVSAQNIFYQSIRLIKDKYKILDRETYVEYYENILKDIELETSPIDCFVPNIATPNPDGEDVSPNTPNFVVNQNVNEYERISKRVTLDDIVNTFPITHEIYGIVKDNPSMLSTIVDDIFTHYCVYRYLDEIEQIRLNIFSSSTPLVEYVVKNITLDVINKHNVSNKINPEKCTKYLKDVFFLPEFALMKKYYMEPHDCIPGINIDTILQKLVSNITLKSDIYIIIGIYITLSFAMTEIRTERYDDECAAYVRDVLSRL